MKKKNIEICNRHDLEAAIYAILADYADGLPVAKVYELLAQRFEFCDDWQRPVPITHNREWSKHGYSHHSEVPAEELVKMVPCEVKWKNRTRYAGWEMKKKGLLTNRERGVWELTDEAYEDYWSSYHDWPDDGYPGEDSSDKTNKD